MRKTAPLSVFSILISIQAVNANAQAPSKCADLMKYQPPAAALEITLAERREHYTPPPPRVGPPITAAFPPHCHIEGALDRRAGDDGKPYAIGFAINLPDEWNGRFLFQGGGGLNGTVQPPLGAGAAGDTPALSRGFAVASTDSGHQGQGPFDAAFFADQEALLNFHQFANAKVTIIAKQLIAEYYGSPARHSYFVGCSTGGREGMVMSQRFPFYYDGIVAGAPAMRTGLSNLALKWISVQLNRVATRDASGKPVPGTAFTEAERKLIVNRFLETCDANDGLADGLVFDTHGCRFDPAALVCQADKRDQCLRAEQAQALQRAFAGPKDSTGYPVYTGFLFDTGIAAQGFIPGLLMGGTSPVDPAGGAALQQDVDAEARAATEPVASFGDSTWTNLNSFSGNGGKLIFYHGVSDAWFSALDTIDYYERMSAANGGMEQVRNWSRAFLVPGMLHCNGGQALDRFDMLTAIVDWVEKGKAPDRIIATGRAYPGRSRPLCPWPEFARYTGSGDSEDEVNFECRE
jgi:feruloyl esterase